MGLISAVKDVVSKAREAANDVAAAAIHGLTEAQGFLTKLAHGNFGDQAVPMPDVIKKVISGSSSTWHEGVFHARTLADRHSEISTGIAEIAAGLEAAWTGSAADAARARIKPFADVTATAAQSFTDNSNNLSNLAYSFDKVQAEFRAQPLPARPDKGFFDVASPWDTDIEDRVTAYNKLVQQHLARYERYASTAAAGRSQLKLDYGQVDPFAGADFIITDGGSGTTGSGSAGGQVVGAPTFTGSSGGGGRPEVSEPVVTGWRGGPPQHSTPSVPAASGSGFVEAQPDVTRTAGFVPPEVAGRPTVPTGGSVPSAPGVGPGAGAVAGFGGGGGRAAGTGAVGKGSGVGSLGKGAGSGPVGSGSVGRGAGVGSPGMAGGVSSAAAGRGAPGGKAGAAGAPGFGGAPAGRGRGEDDDEHRDRYAQPDASLFELDGDEPGQLLVDPHTGLPVVPPTIGG